MTRPRSPKDTMPHVALAYWGQELEVKPLKCQNQITQYEEKMQIINWVIGDYKYQIQ